MRTLQCFTLIAFFTLFLNGCGKKADLEYSFQLENVSVQGVVLNASFMESEVAKIQQAIEFSEPL